MLNSIILSRSRMPGNFNYGSISTGTNKNCGDVAARHNIATFLE
jgi:hypothetical protein